MSFSALSPVPADFEKGKLRTWQENSSSVDEALLPDTTFYHALLMDSVALAATLVPPIFRTIGRKALHYAVLSAAVGSSNPSDLALRFLSKNGPDAGMQISKR